MMIADAAQSVALGRLTQGLPLLNRPRLTFAIRDVLREQAARKAREERYATARRESVRKTREEQAAGEVLAESPLLSLKYQGNMTEDEIAEHTGLTKHAVRECLAAELTKARQLLL